jgi:hypothetical protein
MEPPCGECKPELKEANEPYFVLYSYCGDQLIMGSHGAVGLNMLAVKDAMKDYGIDPEEYIEFSYKVREIAGIVIREQMNELEEKMKRNK